MSDYQNCPITYAAIKSGMAYPDIIDLLARELHRRQDQLTKQASLACGTAFSINGQPVHAADVHIVDRLGEVDRAFLAKLYEGIESPVMVLRTHHEWIEEDRAKAGFSALAALRDRQVRSIKHTPPALTDEQQAMVADLRAKRTARKLASHGRQP